MMNDEAGNTHLEIQNILQPLGSRLKALYQYSGPTTESSLLAVIDDPSAIHAIRDLLLPTQQPSSPSIQVATPAALTRHLQLDPVMANSLQGNGRLLTGQPQQIPTQTVSPARTIALLALSALKASESLAPELPSNGARQIIDQNRRLLLNKFQITGTESAVADIAAIYSRLAARLNRHPDLVWHSEPPGSAPPIIDALLAIYEVRDKVIFLLPDWPPDQIEAYINEVSWTAVIETLEDQYQGVQLSTPSLMRLIYEQYRSAEHFTQSYQHLWGLDPLDSLQPGPARIYRSLACFPSHIEISTLPRAYITAPEDRVRKLIHDYQNNLLNIQLREELISRREGRSRRLPPHPLPGIEASTQERIDIIFKHFNWWAGYYADLTTDSKV